MANCSCGGGVGDFGVHARSNKLPALLDMDREPADGGGGLALAETGRTSVILVVWFRSLFFSVSVA